MSEAQANYNRLQASLLQIEDLRTEITALGLDPDRHGFIPLQNQLLAGAVACLEGMLWIQRLKFREAQQRLHPPTFTREQVQPIQVPAYFSPGTVPPPSCSSADPPS
jgi:hypothetical protein